MTTKTTTLGQRIKAARTAQGLTQRAIAASLGMQPLAATRWENDTRTPDAATIVRLCDLLHVSADYLLDIKAKPVSDLQ